MNTTQFQWRQVLTAVLGIALPATLLLVGQADFYSFTQPVGVSGITYGAEWSATLAPGSWQPISDTGSGNAHLFSVPIGSNAQLFIRLNVTDP